MALIYSVIIMMNSILKSLRLLARDINSNKPIKKWLITALFVAETVAIIILVYNVSTEFFRVFDPITASGAIISLFHFLSSIIAYLSTLKKMLKYGDEFKTKTEQYVFAYICTWLYFSVLSLPSYIAVVRFSDFSALHFIRFILVLPCLPMFSASLTTLSFRLLRKRKATLIILSVLDPVVKALAFIFLSFFSLFSLFDKFYELLFDYSKAIELYHFPTGFITRGLYNSLTDIILYIFISLLLVYIQHRIDINEHT